MKIAKNLSLILLLLFSLELCAQDSIPRPKLIERGSVGVGGGMDFGGFGINFLVYPYQNVGFFGGAGYALIGIGYNVGSKIRLAADRAKAAPYLLAMYGYNTAIKVSGASEYNKFFYGPTIGFGLDLAASPERLGYWSFAVLIPIRSSNVDTYMNDLKNYHSVKFDNGLFPIGISVSYRIIWGL